MNTGDLYCLEAFFILFRLWVIRHAILLPPGKISVASVTNHALASLQNIAQGSNSLWNHSRPIPPGTRHANYPRNPFIHALSLIFLPFLITRHSLRASILYIWIYIDSYAYMFIQTLFMEGGCWRLFNFLPFVGLRLLFPSKFPLLSGTEYSGGSVTVTNIATVI